MAQTNRFDPDVLERKERLAKRGKLPNRSRSRRSDRIRAVAESEREEMEMFMYDDDLYYIELGLE